MRLAYSRTKFSFLIRLGQWFTPYSHMGVVTPEGTVINSRMIEGVIEETIEQFEKRASAFAYVDVAVPDEKAGILWARSRVGNKYDYGAIRNFISNKFGTNKPEAKRDMCVMIGEGAVRMAGRNRFRVDLRTVTVHQSFIAQNA